MTIVSKTKPVPALHPVYLRLLCSILRARGHDTAALFAAAGIKPTDIGLEARHIPPTKMAFFLRSVRQQCTDPLLPLEWASLAAASHAHGMLGAALQTSSNLRQALQTVCELSPLRTTILRLRLIQREEEALLEADADASMSDLHDFVFLMFAVLLARLIGTLIGQASRRLHQELPMARPAWGDVEVQFFQYPVSYGASAFQLHIPRDLLDEPCETADPTVYIAAVRQCRFEVQNQSSDISMKVIAYLIEREGQYPSLTTAALHLNASPRSLSRALHNEGCSYQDLVDDVKKLHAQNLLHDPKRTIDQVAERLGYAETTNFIRAFRRWEGCTPQQFRARLHASHAPT